MAAQAQPRWSVEDYLAQERAGEIKHEYYDGEIFVMSGASRAHNLICANLLATLHGQLRPRGCEIYPGDMRVHAPATGLYTYPDVTVACDPPRFEDETFDTLLNPSLIAEVLSPSTEDYDRGRKFAHYRGLPSLQLYLMIAQKEHHIELYVRQAGERWLFSETRDPDAVLDLDALGAKLRMADLYAGVPGIEA